MQAQVALAHQADGGAPAAEPPAHRAATTVEDLRNGWRLIANAWLGEAPIQVVLIQPGIGVALMQLHPHWTPDALDRLRRRMAEAGFAAAHPGTLPMIHRRLRPQDVPNLDVILADAFVWQDPITLARDSGWEDALTDLLAPGILRKPAAAPPAEPRPVEPAGTTPAPRRSPWRGPALAGSAALAAGLVLLALADRDRWAPPREAPPAAPMAEALAPAGTPDRAGTAPPAAEVMPDPAPPAPVAEALGAGATLPPPAEAMPDPALPAPAVETLALGETAPPPAEAPPAPAPLPILLAALGPWPAAPMPAPMDEPRDAPLVEPLAIGPVGPPAPPLPVAVPALPPPAPHATAPLPALRAPPARLALPPIRLADASVPGSPALAAPALLPLLPAPGLQGPPRAPSVPLAAAPPAVPEGPLQAAPAPPPAPAAALPAAPATRPIPPPAGRPPVPPAEAMVQAPDAPGPAALPPGPAPAAPLSPALDAMQRRGEEMLANGDISGARRLLEPAARAGSATAAQALAETYDPAMLARRGVIGLPPDRAQALFWYRRAAALGAAVAPRIASLEAEP